MGSLWAVCALGSALCELSSRPLLRAALCCIAVSYVCNFSLRCGRLNCAVYMQDDSAVLQACCAPSPSLSVLLCKLHASLLLVFVSASVLAHWLCCSCVSPLRCPSFCSDCFEASHASYGRVCRRPVHACISGSGWLFAKCKHGSCALSGCDIRSIHRTCRATHCSRLARKCYVCPSCCQCTTCVLHPRIDSVVQLLTHLTLTIDRTYPTSSVHLLHVRHIRRLR